MTQNYNKNSKNSFKKAHDKKRKKLSKIIQRFLEN